MRGIIISNLLTIAVIAGYFWFTAGNNALSPHAEELLSSLNNTSLWNKVEESSHNGGTYSVLIRKDGKITVTPGFLYADVYAHSDQSSSSAYTRRGGAYVRNFSFNELKLINRATNKVISEIEGLAITQPLQLKKDKNSKLVAE